MLVDHGDVVGGEHGDHTIGGERGRDLSLDGGDVCLSSSLRNLVPFSLGCINLCLLFT